MAKACWNCLFGEGTRGEEAYSIHRNEDITLAPLWPEPQYENEKMFILPKILGTNDTISIIGKTFEQRERLTVNLITGSETADYSNIACQLQIHFLDPVVIAIHVIKDGQAEAINDEKPAEISFLRSEDPLSFQVMFKIRSEQMLDIHMGPSKDIQKVGSVELKHDLKEIKFLTVHGDIDKVVRLDFKFG